jgi:hypothetical protein
MKKQSALVIGSSPCWIAWLELAIVKSELLRRMSTLVELRLNQYAGRIRPALTVHAIRSKKKELLFANIMELPSTTKPLIHDAPPLVLSGAATSTLDRLIVKEDPLETVNPDPPLR